MGQQVGFDVQLGDEQSLDFSDHLFILHATVTLSSADARLVRVIQLRNLMKKSAAIGVIVAVAFGLAMHAHAWPGQAATPPQSPAVPAEIMVPPGFKATVFASDLQGARLMAVSPEGVLLVARRPRHEVVALPDRNKDGVAEPEVLLSGLTNAHSLAFKDGYLYIATTPAVMRVKWANGQPFGAPEKVVRPSELHAVGPRDARPSTSGRDGRPVRGHRIVVQRLRGADPRRTTIQVFNGRRLARSRSPSGCTTRSASTGIRKRGRMWASDTGQDGLGDDVPPDEINLDRRRASTMAFPFFIGQQPTE